MALSSSDPYFDLGAFTWKINTSSADAQVWFDRGITWAYGFHHEEAVSCFEQVVAHDPQCLMGYFGIAYSSGPHYNKSWSAFDVHDLKVCYERGFKALQTGSAITDNVLPLERALLGAIKTRFPPRPESQELDHSAVLYADAMKKVFQQHGDSDLNVLVMAADALMNTAPWHLFDSKTGQPNLETPVLEIGDILRQGMKHPDANDHPGLLHLYIHYIEMSTTPEAALIPADRLRYLVPDSGHLQHMPSHIYILVGDYRQAMDANLKASHADDKYWSFNSNAFFYTVYRLHNFHSLIYAAMLAGQSRLALETCDRMEAALPEELLRTPSPPMADWTEIYHSVRMHVLIRFGMWDTIKSIPLPADQTLYCSTTAFIHYAKGIAFAATGHTDLASKQQVLFRNAASKVPSTRIDFPNTVSSMLSIADAMLSGELAYRLGNYEEAFEHLETAISLDDSLIYSEPWGWQVPTRHAYGALLLEQGRYQDAAQAYAQDLGINDSLAAAHQHPNNIWALQGYAACLYKLERRDEARVIEQALKIAKAVADVNVGTSCFCARIAMEDEMTTPLPTQDEENQIDIGSNPATLS